MLISFDATEASTDSRCSSDNSLNFKISSYGKESTYKIKIQSTIYESTSRFDMCFAPLMRFAVVCWGFAIAGFQN